jgi:putative FmdB family regulatory protein
MPTYQYRCEQCRFTFEQSQSVEDRDEPILQPCSRCGCKIKRMIVPCTFHLKGEGWAKDGYVNKTKAALNREDI